MVRNVTPRFEEAKIPDPAETTSQRRLVAPKSNRPQPPVLARAVAFMVLVPRRFSMLFPMTHLTSMAAGDWLGFRAK